jgi:neutral ceramidase
VEVALGDHVLVALPAEVTTMSGVRIREALADALNLPMPDASGNVGRGVVVVGLTNEYLQYVATPEEYTLQFYEGASTLYGPNTTRMLRDHVQCLGRALVGGDADACRLQQPKVNVLTKWRHPELDDAELLQAEPEAARAPHSLGAPETEVTRDGLLAVSVAFVGPEPDSVRERKDLWVELRREAGEALVDDDRGVSVLTEWKPYTYEGVGWTATWIPEIPRVRAECDQRFYFVIGNGAGQVRSSSFAVDCSKLTDLSAVWP